MTSNQIPPLLDIDLNVQFTHPEIDNEDPQPKNAEESHPLLPNLNRIIPESFSIDLNTIPNTPPVDQFSFDLNIQPYVDSEIEFNEENSYTHIDEEPHEENEAGNNVHEDVELEFDGNNIDDMENLELLEVSKRRMNSATERRTIYEALLQRSINGKLKKGVTKLVAAQFSVHIRTVQRIWLLAKNEGVHIDLSYKKTKNCGRKRIQLDFDRVREIPLNQRTSIRSFAYALNWSVGSLHRRLKSRDLRRHLNAIKPSLTEENKIARLRFCISMLDSATVPQDPTFLPMHNIIHIDEKWFYMTKKSNNYYLLQDEEDPTHFYKNKNFIVKVMFLSAIARPRFNAQGNDLFSGKIGIFPLITQEPAKRSSIHRTAGTLETKPIQSVKKEVIRTFLVEKVLPAIKEKWPREEIGSLIFIQQDNARTHIDSQDEEFCRVASQDGFDICLMRQPPNSPDLNVLDLGFFNAIQSLQYKEAPKSIDELICVVPRSFEEFSATKSNHIFLTLQSCMIEIVKVRGSNNYKIPHLKKAMLERENQLPTQLKCDPALVQDIFRCLD